MDSQMLHMLMATVELVNANLDTAPGSWRDQLPAIRNITTSFEISDTAPEQSPRCWQIPHVTVVQRVAFADADNGPIPDIADWCLRQLLTLLALYPRDAEILAFTVIGRHWLLRAQKALASIARAESELHSNEESSPYPLQSAKQPLVETQERINNADYVEARALLVPATDYLQSAVDAAREKGQLTGHLLLTASTLPFTQIFQR
ncbi:hypothetical protein COCMIDRAFT_37056 [Bipolaris oryzae ATCC 44560]|uniref:Uncharacterized protein n=1 Tax=Bipolaris oryzae ATCC 44560 TaxID=930090 RepID=W6Z5Y4_COCMI|nr:uncharacterized protein COCMIDRAFT_37056 [Bipolaris oryzae ATCC 44560]EUC45183.1 hypothetical protein COCMIDRAFT_37056 [Bipolaris oryzae ATCC 44560]